MPFMSVSCPGGIPGSRLVTTAGWLPEHVQSAAEPHTAFCADAGDASRNQYGNGLWSGHRGAIWSKGGVVVYAYDSAWQLMDSYSY